MNRLDPADLKHRLQSLGAYSKKHLGQHFLIDATVLGVILETANVTQQDTVVEIGPGPGVLTERLVHSAKEVIAFELDPHMVSLLKADFPGLKLHQGDVLKVAPEVIKTLREYKVVANIPYQITTPLLKLFLEGGVSPVPESMTLLMQKEVGARLAAPAKSSDRGYLSVLTQYFAEVTVAAKVPPSAFWPAPEVDSAVVHLVIKQKRPLAPSKEPDFLKYVKGYFLHQRKQLKNVIAGVRGKEVDEVVALLQKQGLPETVRAQELTEEQWLSLFNSGL